MRSSRWLKTISVEALALQKEKENSRADRQAAFAKTGTHAREYVVKHLDAMSTIRARFDKEQAEKKEQTVAGVEDRMFKAPEETAAAAVEAAKAAAEQAEQAEAAEAAAAVEQAETAEAAVVAVPAAEPVAQAVGQAASGGGQNRMEQQRKALQQAGLRSMLLQVQSDQEARGAGLAHMTPKPRRKRRREATRASSTSSDEERTCPAAPSSPLPRVQLLSACLKASPILVFALCNGDGSGARWDDMISFLDSVGLLGTAPVENWASGYSDSSVPARVLELEKIFEEVDPENIALRLTI